VKRCLLLAISCLAVLLVGTTTAQAAGYLEATTAALKSSLVYVAPGIPGTSSDTASTLQQQLNEGDNIALVMLPQEALAETGDIQTFAKKLDDATAHKRILGLAIGTKLIGYSSLLPASTASDLMDRAVSVSTSVPESLGTFVRNVHSWQRQHPNEPAAKPPARTQKKPSGFPWGVIIIAAIIGSILAALARYALRDSSSTNEEENIEFHATPRQVRELLEQILRLRTQIDDSELLRDTITQLCRDSEAYFRRIENAMHEVDAFKAHLEEIQRVLIKYIDVQNNKRYYSRWTEYMEQGRNSVSDFADFLLARIRRESELSMTDYYVDTKILAAQKYRTRR